MKLDPYSEDVISFVTISVETCILLEHVSELEKNDFIEKLLLYLPLLYQKTRLLGRADESAENYVGHYVEESDYNMITAGVKEVLRNDDAYLEVFIDDMRYSDTPITCFISENLADIYQELKNMALNYHEQTSEVMIEAIYACIDAFYEHWGQKLLNSLRALHNIDINDLSE